MPQSSVRHSIAPTPLMPSTTSNALLGRTTRPMASMSWPTPVLVSIRVVKTATASGCSSSSPATWPASKGFPHGTSHRTTSMPKVSQIFRQRSANLPDSKTMALPPRGTRFTTAASMAPVPELVKTRTSFFVARAYLRPSKTSFNSARNSGVR